MERKGNTESWKKGERVIMSEKAMKLSIITGCKIVFLKSYKSFENRENVKKKAKR